MKAAFILLLSAGLIFLVFLAAKNVVKHIINLWVLMDSKKNPQKYPRAKDGLIYNRKTKKLESTSNEVILPF